jgi:TolB-like protein/DNA-binding winged helix-turn-helix (wHTH) protein
MVGVAGELVPLNGFTVDLAAEALRDADGNEVPLRAQSFAVLRHLVANAGRIVSKDELNCAVWDGVAVTDDSLVQCVRDVRRAIGDTRQDIVRTVPRRGYRLDPPETTRHPSSPWGIPVRAAAALALLALVATVLWQGLRPPPVAAALDIPVVAVLPFETIGPDPALDYLGRGVASDIIAMLARAPDMAVVSAPSSFPFGSAPVDPRTVGAELGAGYLLAGDVRREGDRLRVTAQLVEAGTGRHLWAERFDRTGADPLALQDEIAGRVVGALTGERGMIKRAQYREAWGKDSASLGEYDYYLRGNDVFMRFESRQSNERAGAIWREGLARYPDSTLLTNRLGWYHYKAGQYLWSDDPAADFERAGALARQVLAQDGLTPLVQRYSYWLLAQTLVHEGRIAEAIAAAQTVIAVAPNDAFVLWALANTLIKAGETDPSAEWFEKATRLDPRQRSLHHPTQGHLYYLQERYEEALAEFALGMPLTPDMKLLRAIALVRLDRLDAAREQVRAALRDEPGLDLARWQATMQRADPALLEAEIADLARAGLPE